MRCFGSNQEGMEKEENAIVFEDFPFVYNSAVFLRKLFEKKKYLSFVVRRSFSKGGRRME
jgi:hypothetical protein